MRMRMLLVLGCNSALFLPKSPAKETRDIEPTTNQATKKSSYPKLRETYKWPWSTTGASEATYGGRAEPHPVDADSWLGAHRGHETASAGIRCESPEQRYVRTRPPARHSRGSYFSLVVRREAGDRSSRVRIRSIARRDRHPQLVLCVSGIVSVRRDLSDSHVRSFHS